MSRKQLSKSGRRTWSAADETIVVYDTILILLLLNWSIMCICIYSVVGQYEKGLPIFAYETGMIFSLM